MENCEIRYGITSEKKIFLKNLFLWKIVCKNMRKIFLSKNELYII